MTKILAWFKCLIGEHEEYSEEQDLGYIDLDIKLCDMTEDEMQYAVKLLTIRCRHCDWTYSVF